MTGPLRYAAFGLRVASARPLPELRPYAADGADSNSAPEVQVTWGPWTPPPLAAGGATRWLAGSGGDLRLWVRGVACFGIAGGRHVTVGPERGVPDDTVRPFLFGSAFPAMLYQRGLLPLHASAIAAAGGAWCFTAPSGTGKSTLAARLHAETGASLVADDVSVLAFPGAGDGAVPQLLPGATVLKLDPEGGMPAPFAVARRLPVPSHKWLLSVPEAFVAGPVPLRGLVVLERAGHGAAGTDNTGVVITPVHGHAALRAVLQSCHRPAIAEAVLGRAAWMTAAARLAAGTPVLSAVVRPDVPGASVLEALSRVLDGTPPRSGGVWADRGVAV